MARSLSNERSMPLYLWGEAVRNAIYILNKLPTRVLSKKTPYESWTGKRQYFDYIKVFGCMAHMKVPGVHLKKLDDRIKSVIYLGKEPGTNAYRLYDPNIGAVQVSRDVIFEEEKSFMWTEQES